MADKKLPPDRNKTKQEKTKGSSNGSNKKRNIRKPLKIILISLVALILVGGISGAGLFAYYVKDSPSLDKELLQTVETSILYDNQGNEVTALHAEQNRLYLPLTEIPEHMQKRSSPSKMSVLISTSALTLSALCGPFTSTCAR